MVANSLAGVSAAQSAGQVEIAVLKKALDAGAQASLALIQALPPVPSLPPNLGNFIDTIA